MSEQEVFDTLKYHIEVDEHGNRLYCNNAGKWHRENGPAVEYTSGAKRWYYNGRLHRTDGPAVLWADGNKFWWLNGQPVTEAQFNQEVNHGV
jgi:hypothetical protein